VIPIAFKLDAGTYAVYLQTPDYSQILYPVEGFGQMSAAFELEHLAA
jgi:hypothetical protein